MTPITVPVIASFSTDGQIKPIYIRINGVSLKVTKCTAHMTHINPTFQCIVDDFGIAKPVKISYHPSTYSWIVIDC